MRTYLSSEFRTDGIDNRKAHPDYAETYECTLYNFWKDTRSSRVDFCCAPALKIWFHFHLHCEGTLHVCNEPLWGNPTL